MGSLLYIHSARRSVLHLAADPAYKRALTDITAIHDLEVVGHCDLGGNIHAPDRDATGSLADAIGTEPCPEHKASASALLLPSCLKAEPDTHPGLKLVAVSNGAPITATS